MSDFRLASSVLIFISIAIISTAQVTFTPEIPPVPDASGADQVTSNSVDLFDLVSSDASSLSGYTNDDELIRSFTATPSDSPLASLPPSPISLTEGATGWTYINENWPGRAMRQFPDFPGDSGETGTAKPDSDADGSGNDLEINIPHTDGMSYSFWVSGGGDLPYVDDSIYRLTWRLKTSGFADRYDAPTIRCRAGYGIWGELGHFELVVTPTALPPLDTSTEYRMIIEHQDVATATMLETSPNGNVAPQNSLTLFFDVYDFSNEIGGGAVELESLTSERIDLAPLLLSMTTEVLVTDFSEGLKIDPAFDLDFSQQDQTRAFAPDGVTMTSDVSGWAGGGTTDLNVIPSDGPGELFGLPLVMDQVSVGIIPVKPSNPSAERIYRASYTADTSSNEIVTPLPDIVMSLSTYMRTEDGEGILAGQLYTAQMGVLPTANSNTTTNPGYDAGQWALYLQLPPSMPMTWGGGIGIGNNIGSSFYYRDQSLSRGGTIVVTEAAIHSIDASILP